MLSAGAPGPPGRIAAALGALTLAAAAVAGCGAASPEISGRAVFATHCSTCHSISGSSTPRQQGGDLKSLRLPRRELLQYTEEMPVVHGRMSSREMRAVVAYVQSVERH